MRIRDLRLTIQTGGNISSFRNVASDLLDGQMAPSVSATAFRIGARYPSLIDVRSLWLELGLQARYDLLLIEVYEISFPRKTNRWLELENHGLILVYFGEIPIFQCY